MTKRHFLKTAVQNEMVFRFIETGVDSKYSVGKEISSGAFGVVIEARDRVTGDIVAIKVKKFHGSPTSDLDAKIAAYKRLQGVHGIPRAMSYGSNFIAMERLGHSLADIQRKNNYKPFPLRSILLIAEQLIARIESMHSHGISHRDIKLDNLVMGLGASTNVVHVIDFGLAIADDLNHCRQTFRKIDLKQAGLAIKSLYQGSICNLKDGDKINYKYLSELFRETFRNHVFTGNVIFDW